MRAVVEALENEPTVDNVLWLDRAPPLNIFGLPEPIFPRSDASAGSDLQPLRKRRSTIRWWSAS